MTAVAQLFLLIVLLFTSGVKGWSCPGHMIIAEIARRHLSEKNLLTVELMAKEFAHRGPFPESPDFVQLACWADDVKTWDMFAMSNWHYIDIPYNPEHINSSTLAKVDTMNVISAINDMRTALRTNRSSHPFILHFALANLIHLVGDVHQPLHTTTRYSHKFPHGDRGGNKVLIRVNSSWLDSHHDTEEEFTITANNINNNNNDKKKSVNHRKHAEVSNTKNDYNNHIFDVATDTVQTVLVRHGNLHALWDEMCHLSSSSHKTWHRPLSHAGYETLRNMADMYEDSNKFSPEQYSVHSISSIAKESHKFAINTTYTCVDVAVNNNNNDNNDKDEDDYVDLSNDYLEECKRVVAQRITLAGRRLAYILNNILDEYEVECSSNIDHNYCKSEEDGDSVYATNDNNHINNNNNNNSNYNNNHQWCNHKCEQYCGDEELEHHKAFC